MVFAVRAQHLYEIEPALRDGKWVLCDRFTDATYAYQGYGRGFDSVKLKHLSRWFNAEDVLDITLLFDIDPKLGMARVMQALNSIVSKRSWSFSSGSEKVT